ncbi:MAG: FliA/WhiG family RNA polymerase sigma factor [Phycisphaerae bacterium]|nr:FliA/WhiG family RNA polymerase sigma factor [Phycisphaerae bacterium]NUQ45600.1 FliA/WhiG family RNA polymerase sigma factor [Phycisphaerae bacterium]
MASVQIQDNVGLWRAFKAGHADSVRNQLVEMYMPLVNVHAKMMCAKFPRCVEFDDLVSTGVLGLIEAVESYDPDRGVKFSTYCAPRVRGAILDELRKLDWIPRLTRARRRQIRVAINELESELERQPSDDEIAQRVGIDRESYRDMSRHARIASVVQLDAISGDEPDERHFSLMDPRSPDPSEEIERRDLCDTAPRHLGRGDRYILKRYYVDEVTMKELGATLGLSESRISQKLTSIHKKLRDVIESDVARAESPRLRPFRVPAATDTDPAIPWTAEDFSDEAPQVRVRRPRKTRSLKSAPSDAALAIAS